MGARGKKAFVTTARVLIVLETTQRLNESNIVSWSWECSKSFQKIDSVQNWRLQLVGYERYQCFPYAFRERWRALGMCSLMGTL